MPHSCKVPSKGVVHDFGVGRVTAVTAFGRHGVCCRATRSASHRRLSGSSPQVAGRRFPSRSGRLTGPVSPNGTAVYDAVADLLALVARAVNLARHEGFAHSCRPEHGRLLFALAAGAEVSRSDRRDRDRLRGGPGLAGVGRTPRGPGWSASNGTPGGAGGAAVLWRAPGDCHRRRLAGDPPARTLRPAGPGRRSARQGQPPRRPTRTSCSGRAAPWSSTTSSRPGTGRPGTLEESMRPGCPGWVTPGWTRLS